MGNYRMLDTVLTICAAGYRVHVGNLPPILVCGQPPGHQGPHRDIEWDVRWADAAVTDV